MELSVTEQAEDSLRELYRLYCSSKNETTKLCVAWDILELYLARASKTHDWPSQASYASKSSTLNSLLRVLSMDPDFRRKLDNIEGIAPAKVGDQTIEFTKPTNFVQLITIVKLARDTMFTGSIDHDAWTQLTTVLNQVLAPLIKELVPCVE